jgi:hypothetical protein
MALRELLASVIPSERECSRLKQVQQLREATAGGRTLMACAIAYSRLHTTDFITDDTTPKPKNRFFFRTLKSLE